MNLFCLTSLIWSPKNLLISLVCSIKNIYCFIIDQDVAAELAEIHEKFVVVPADKASNNIVFVCKTHYINCLIEELGISTMTGNPTYNLTAMSKE